MNNTPTPAHESALSSTRLQSVGEPVEITQLESAETVKRDLGFPEIPGYVIDCELGEGGMGIVYKAIQLQAKRVVALKMISFEKSLLGTGTARFQIEVEAIARIDHPNVVKVFDVGEVNGKPFFTMEYCSGGSLSSKLNGTPWEPHAAAELVEKLARGMGAAHAEGIIHRDLKPQNILLAEKGEPKITDFGLAKRLDDDQGQTQTGAVMGTPSYMSPEQAAGESRQLNASTDVHAFGILLFELLTGRRPFVAASTVDLLNQIRSSEPISPRSLAEKIPRDLETICLKCLSKKPDRRYPDASQLADDLRRFREGKPILARPIGSGEKLLKWTRRHPSLALLISCLFIFAVMLFAGGIWFTLQLDREKSDAFKARDDFKKERDQVIELSKQLKDSNKEVKAGAEQLKATLATSRIRLIDRDLAGGNFNRARDQLREIEPHLRNWEWQYLNRTWAGSAATIHGHAKPIDAITVHPDGSVFVTAVFADNKLRWWEARTLQLLHEVVPPVSATRGTCYLRDARTMVSWGGDYEQEGSIVIWNAQTREVIRHWTVAPKPVLSVSCSNDGDWLIAFSENGRLTKWNLATGEKLAEWELPEVELASVAVVPGSSSFIVGGTDKSGKGFVRLLDSRTGEILWRYDRPEFTVGQVAISPDGRTFAASSPKQGFRMWAFFRGSIESVVSRATHTCDAIAFSPDSAYVVVSGTDRTIYLEEIRGGWSALLPAGHQDRIRALAFSADGSKLLSGSDDLTVKFWDARGVPQQLTRWSRQRNLTALTVSADESILASGASDGSIELWETTAKHPQRRIHDHRDAITSLAVLNRGTQLISSSLDQHLILRDLKTGETLAKKRFDKLFPNSLAVSRDGKMVAVGLFAFGTPGKTQLLSLPNLEPLGEPFSGHLFGITGVRFANEDRDLITASGDDAISVWDIANHQLRFRLKHTLAVTCLNLSPDGKKLVSGAGQGTQPGEIRVWDLTTGKQLLDLGGHTREVTAVDWSLDGSRIVSGSGFLDTPAELKVWDARNGDELLTIPLAETGRVQLLFTPRIGQLITSVGERDRVSKLTVWQLRRDLPQKLYRGSPGYLKRVGYLNGEHELFAVDMLGNLTRWNRSTGELRPTEGIPIPKRGQLLRSDGSELLQLDGTQLIAWNLNRPFEEQSFLREFTDLDWGWHEQQRNHFFAAKDYRPALFHQQWLMRADPKPGEQKLLRELQDQLFERLPAPRELP